MTTLVAYASRQGCSEKSARLIQRMLGGGCDIVDVDIESDIELVPYDTVIIGGPIYYGKLRASVRGFSEAYLPQLLQRRIGLYICCMEQGERALQELREGFPSELLEHASATGFFGGEIHMERISFVERFIVRAVVRTEYNLTTFSEERVSRFLQRLFSA
ncbi:MAG: flavodoxin domain-containing protein [Candidatus Thiodiazotropha sp.]